MRTAAAGTARRAMVAGALHTSACEFLHESTNSSVKPRTIVIVVGGKKVTYANLRTSHKNKRLRRPARP